MVLKDLARYLGFPADDSITGGKGYYPWALPAKKKVDELVELSNGGKGDDEYIQGVK